MSGELPERVDPFRLAGQGAVLSGDIPIASMPRLAGLILDTDGVVAAEVRFSRGSAGRPAMAGRIRGRLRLCCQRCMEPMDHDLDLGFEVTLVENEADEEEVLKEGEPLLVAEGSLPLREAVEDEIMLGLPVVPRHPPGRGCNPPEPEFSADDAAGGSRNPFGVLAALRRDPDK